MGDNYDDRAACIRTMRDRSYKAQAGRWCWQMPIARGVVIAGTRTYASEAAARRAAGRIMRVVFRDQL